MPVWFYRFNHDRQDRHMGGGGGGGVGGIGFGGGQQYNRGDYHHNRPDFYGGYRGDRPNNQRSEHYRHEYGHHYREQHFPRHGEEWGQGR